MGTAQPHGMSVSDPIFSATWDVKRPSEQFQMVLSVAERIVDVVAVIAGSLSGYSAYLFLELGKRIHYSIGTVLTIGFVFAVVCGHVGIRRSI
jgi:hypothetical protein